MNNTPSATFTSEHDLIPYLDGMLDFNCDWFARLVQRSQEEERWLIHLDSADLIHYFRYGE